MKYLMSDVLGLRSEEQWRRYLKVNVLFEPLVQKKGGKKSTLSILPKICGFAI